MRAGGGSGASRARGPGAAVRVRGSARGRLSGPRSSARGRVPAAARCPRPRPRTGSRAPARPAGGPGKGSQNRGRRPGGRTHLSAAPRRGRAASRPHRVPDPGTRAARDPEQGRKPPPLPRAPRLPRCGLRCRLQTLRAPNGGRRPKYRPAPFKVLLATGCKRTLPTSPSPRSLALHPPCDHLLTRRWATSLHPLETPADMEMH
ncbi:uncharacterized protein [Manis javanica]|uniref:uncharacterized protein n=1 Tax=Manis javanica TaxID=9974 RepID=UPI003C6D9D50